MVDYSVWDHIEVSNDEDNTHPNIDSLFRWQGERGHAQRGRRLQKEAGRVSEEDERVGATEKVERSWQKKEDLQKKLKNMPWNVDTLSKEGFSKSVFNVKDEKKADSAEQKRFCIENVIGPLMRSALQGSILLYSSVNARPSALMERAAARIQHHCCCARNSCAQQRVAGPVTASHCCDGRQKARQYGRT
uniref:Hsp90 co-chaperone Cdc37 n=1 Tax=Leptobrachium leishanense TaxID=445787 RepID=A0A8C5MGX1_9ANUR